MYSMDSEQNKVNPATPSQVVLSDQLIYRIASLDASVQSGFRRLDEKMDRLQTDMHDRHMEINDRVNQLDKEVSEGFLRKRNRIDALEARCAEDKRKAEDRYVARCTTVDNRIHDIETWQKVLVARISIVGAAIVVLWTIFGPAIQHTIGVS